MRVSRRDRAKRNPQSSYATGKIRNLVELALTMALMNDAQEQPARYIEKRVLRAAESVLADLPESARRRVIARVKRNVGG